MESDAVTAETESRHVARIRKRRCFVPSYEIKLDQTENEHDQLDVWNISERIQEKYRASSEKC